MSDETFRAIESSVTELEQIAEDSERRLKATIKVVASHFGFSDPSRRPPAVASMDEVIRLFDEQDHRCARCQTEIGANDWELDHSIPYSLGGETSRGNLALLCRPCNRQKGDDADLIAAADHLINRLKSER